jgi:hypothetical protein
MGFKVVQNRADVDAVVSSRSGGEHNGQANADHRETGDH